MSTNGSGSCLTRTYVTADRNKLSPSVSAVAGSRRWRGCWRATEWFSGWGINPSTSPVSSHTPAMSAMEPFGLRACVAQGDLSRRGEGGRVGMHVATFAVGDRAVDELGACLRPDASRARLRGQADPPAHEVTAGVVAKGAGQQPGPGEHLEPVADADHRAAGGDEGAQGVAEAARAAIADVEAEQPAGSEGVAVAEPAGDDDDVGCVDAARVGRQLVDEHDLRLGAGELEGEATSRSRFVPGPARTIAEIGGHQSAHL